VRRCLPAAPPVEAWHGGPCPCPGGSASPGENPARPPSALRQSSAAACRPGVIWTRCLLSRPPAGAGGEGDGVEARHDEQTDPHTAYVRCTGPDGAGPTCGRAQITSDTYQKFKHPCTLHLGEHRKCRPRGHWHAIAQSLLLSHMLQLKVYVLCGRAQRIGRQQLGESIGEHGALPSRDAVTQADPALG